MAAISAFSRTSKALTDDQLRNASMKRRSPFADNVTASITGVTAGYALYRDTKTGKAMKSQYVTIYVTLDLPHVATPEEKKLIEDWNALHPDDQVEIPQFEALSNSHCNAGRKIAEVNKDGQLVGMRTPTGDAWEDLSTAYTGTNPLEVRNAVAAVATVGKKIVFHHDNILTLDGFKPVLGFNWVK